MLDNTVEHHGDPVALMEAEMTYWSDLRKTLVNGKYGAHKQLPMNAKTELLNKIDSRLQRWAQLYKDEQTLIQGYETLRPIWIDILARANMKKHDTATSPHRCGRN